MVGEEGELKSIPPRLLVYASRPCNATEACCGDDALSEVVPWVVAVQVGLELVVPGSRGVGWSGRSRARTSHHHPFPGKAAGFRLHRFPHFTAPCLKDTIFSPHSSRAHNGGRISHNKSLPPSNGANTHNDTPHFIAKLVAGEIRPCLLHTMVGEVREVIVGASLSPVQLGHIWLGGRGKLHGGILIRQNVHTIITIKNTSPKIVWCDIFPSIICAGGLDSREGCGALFPSGKDLIKVCWIVQL